MYVTNFDGSSTPFRVNDPFGNGGCIGSTEFAVTGDLAIYYADPDVFEQYNIYAQSTVTTAYIKLNADLNSYSDVLEFQLSPDGSKVVYRADIDTDDTVDIYSVDSGGGNHTKLNTALNAGAENIVFSGDSSTVAYYKSDGKLVKIPIGGGTNTVFGDLALGVYNDDYNPLAPDFDPEPPHVDVDYAGVTTMKLNQDGSWAGVCTDNGNFYEGRMLSFSTDGLASYDLTQTPADYELGCEFVITPITNRFIFQDLEQFAGVEVWIIDKDGANPIKLHDGTESHPFNWSVDVASDESNLIYSYEYTFSGDQWFVQDLDGSNKVLLSDGINYDYTSWSLISRPLNRSIMSLDATSANNFQLHVRDID